MSYKENIIKLLKNNKISDLLNYLKKNKKEDINLNFKLENDNFFISKIISINDNNLTSYLFDNFDFNLDIVDNDNKTVLYYPIKNNNLELIDIILKYDKKNIGISIIDKTDNNGFTPLFYTVIENNIEATNILLKYESSLFVYDNDNKNIFDKAFEYKRQDILKILISSIDNINILNGTGKNLLQLSLDYNNFELFNLLINKNINVNNQDKENGLTSLHHAIVINNKDLYMKLINKKDINVNIADFNGNSPLHYAILEKNFELVNHILNNFDVEYKISDIYGNTLLHSYLDQNFRLNNDLSEDINFQNLLILIENSNLNTPNNNNLTCLHLLVENYLWDNEIILEKLKKKILNIFIADFNNETVYDKILNKEKLINLVSESYFYNLKKNSDKLFLPWEKNCSKDLKVSDKENCMKKIKNIITKDKISVPQIDKIKINIDSGIFVDSCYYTGTSIDIIFGLIHIKNNFSNVKLVLDYPLTINDEIVNYYKQLGIYYKYKLEYSNFCIYWCYNKIIYPTYFDNFFKNKIDEYFFIIIPIAIETPNGSHANILFYNLVNKTVERFEPNGRNSPRELYFNDNLLDKLLENKFKQIDSKIKYIRPQEYLPIIGFQILESMETDKCYRIGDPNGFCAVWCNWWIEQKLNYPDVNSKDLALKLIEIIKIKNIKFKNLIRNYSKNITDLRDNYLKKYNKDINDWINTNYDEDFINDLEKDLIQLF